MNILGNFRQSFLEYSTWTEIYGLSPHLKTTQGSNVMCFSIGSQYLSTIEWLYRSQERPP